MNRGTIHRLARAVIPLFMLAGAPSHSGGTLRLLAEAGPNSIDPMIEDGRQGRQVFAAVYDGLLGFSRQAGDGPPALVADLAEAIPAAEDNGRAYVFRLRGSIRFSTGAAVSASDVRASLRRLFRVAPRHLARRYAAIVGADACLAGAGCALEGVVADNGARTVTIRLAHPDPDFLALLALPAASVLPAGTPTEDIGTAAAPGSGPYVIASFSPGEHLVLARNPAFRAWSQAAQPAGFADAMIYGFGTPDEAATSAVLAGTQDWMFDPPPRDRLSEIFDRHRGAIHANLAPALIELVLDTARPPFDRPAARTALAAAIDRKMLADLAGGPHVALPACHLLPPALGGDAAPCPAKTRGRIAAPGSGPLLLATGDGVLEQALATAILGVLGDLGYRAELRIVPAGLLGFAVQNSDSRLPASLVTWSADAATPGAMLRPQFACAAVAAGSDDATNASGLCDPALDALMAAAATPADWMETDRRLVATAAVIPLLQPVALDLTSARVGHVVWTPASGVVLSQLWVQ